MRFIASQEEKRNFKSVKKNSKDREHELDAVPKNITRSYSIYLWKLLFLRRSGTWRTPLHNGKGCRTVLKFAEATKNNSDPIVEISEYA